VTLISITVALSQTPTYTVRHEYVASTSCAASVYSQLLLVMFFSLHNSYKEELRVGLRILTTNLATDH